MTPLHHYTPDLLHGWPDMFSADYGLPVVMLGAHDGIHVAPFGILKYKREIPLWLPHGAHIEPIQQVRFRS